MTNNNNSKASSTEMNDDATNCLESQTKTTSITLRALNVWKYFADVEAKKYMFQIFMEKKPHYSTIIN